MIESLAVKNFTVFGQAKFDFAPGLNVVVGENGSGKTHVLKLAYSTIYVCFPDAHDPSAVPAKEYLHTAIARKLVAVFKPDELGRLARRNRKGRQRTEVECRLAPRGDRLAFSLNTASKAAVDVEATPTAWMDKRPVYLPTRELLTIFPNFVSIYENSRLKFDETWRDTCVLLDAPLARGPRESQIKKMLEPLEEIMGGNVELTDSGGFYLNRDGVRMEMHLVAEGIRKLAMIARLIATGSLVDKGYLFWDEPEANLNPKVIKSIAKTILQLCQSGIQVFVASHSLFLIRELDILLKYPHFKDVESRFFGLHRGENGVEVQQGDTIEDIGTIDALNEELSQSDRYLAAEGE